MNFKEMAGDGVQPSRLEKNGQAVMQKYMYTKMAKQFSTSREER